MRLAGWYGKIPGTGDFIARRVPASFSEPWDRWLQSVIEGSRERLGAQWRDAFLSMPAWRFALGPGAVDRSAWIGVLVPSVDSVGRYFPLTVACALPVARLDAVATLLAARDWLYEVEAIALSALAPGTSAAAIDSALAQRRFDVGRVAVPDDGNATRPSRGSDSRMLCAMPAEGSAPAALAALAKKVSEPYSAWLAEASEVFGRSLLVCESLPGGAHFCAMMDGRWLEHGWKLCPLP